METTSLILPMLLAGILAGAVNFYIQYVELPFAKANSLYGEEPPKLSDIIWVALLGYVIIGCAGAFLTPLLDAMLNLKGLETVKDRSGNWVPQHPNYKLVFFGYAVVFGYSTTRLLTGIVDSVLSRIIKRENKQKAIQAAHSKEISATGLPPSNVVQACERHFEFHKSDCSGFAKAVAKDLSITLAGQADDIVDQMQGSDWTKINSGSEAKAKAESGWFVLAGLKGADNVPAHSNGHVAVVVNGKLDHDKYPTAYWGRLGGVGERAKTINYAWNKDSRDKVIYAGQKV